MITYFLQDVLKKIIGHNKTYYEHLSKYGKLVAKEFISKPEYEEPLFKNIQFDKDLLNTAIAEHMYRSGNFDSGEVFSQESKINMTDKFKEQFVELNHITKNLKEKNVENALKWAQHNHKQLQEIGSDLLFSLHQAKYSMLFSEAIDLAIIHYESHDQQ